MKTKLSKLFLLSSSFFVLSITNVSAAQTAFQQAFLQLLSAQSNKAAPQAVVTSSTPAFQSLANLFSQSNKGQTTPVAQAAPQNSTLQALAQLFATKSPTTASQAVVSSSVSTSQSLADFLSQFNKGQTTPVAQAAPQNSTLQALTQLFATKSPTTASQAVVPSSAPTSQGLANLFSQSNKGQTKPVAQAARQNSTLQALAQLFATKSPTTASQAVVPSSAPAAQGLANLFSQSNERQTTPTAQAARQNSTLQALAQLFATKSPTTASQAAVPSSPPVSQGLANLFAQTHEVQATPVAQAEVQNSVPQALVKLFAAPSPTTASQAVVPSSAPAAQGLANLFSQSNKRQTTPTAQAVPQNSTSQALAQLFATKSPTTASQAAVPSSVPVSQGLANLFAQINKGQNNEQVLPDAIERQELQRFMSQRLQQGSDSYGVIGKTLIEDPRYQGFSSIYSLCHYPKIPRLHAYDHTPQHTYLSIEIPRTFVSNDLLTQIFKDVPHENINIFFLAQNSDEENITLRSHYYIDSQIAPGDVTYTSNKPISASIFNLADTALTLKDDNNNDVEEGVFLRSNVSTHPGVDSEGNPTLIASPNNFIIDGYAKNRGALFASVVINHENDPRQSKGALTLHYLPAVENGDVLNDLLNIAINQAQTIEDITTFPAVAQLKDIDNIVEGIAQKVQLRRDRDDD